jgi:hypothetical protein
MSLKNVLQNSKRIKMKIKLSNKILLIAGIVPILFIVLMLLALKFFPWGEVNPQSSSSATSDLITRTFSLEGFSEITINGIPRVNLYRGDTFLTKVSAPEAEVDNIKAEKNGTKLVLDFKSDLKSSTGPKSITADITLPEALTIDTQGVIDINLSGLNIGSLFIRAQGPVSVTGHDAMIRDLKLNSSGLTRIDLLSVPVTNADLECQGVYSIVLMMSGGRLSGNLGGIGSFDYKGKVSVNELKVNGSRNNMAYQAR